MSVARPMDRIRYRNDLIVLAKVSLAGTMVLGLDKFGGGYNLGSENAALSSNLYL